MRRMIPIAVRGMNPFNGKSHCTPCHTGPEFSDQAFHNLGVGMDCPNPDLGREANTKKDADRGKFKALVVVILDWPSDSLAIPASARKYGFHCTMCHSAYPRLNDFGTRYRDNGCSLPGRGTPRVAGRFDGDFTGCAAPVEAVGEP